MRLYYEAKPPMPNDNPYLQNVPYVGSKLSDGMSPIRIEEENLFPQEVKEYHKKSIKIGEFIKLNRVGMGSISKRYGSTKPNKPNKQNKQCKVKKISG